MNVTSPPRSLVRIYNQLCRLAMPHALAAVTGKPYHSPADEPLASLRGSRIEPNDLMAK